MKTNNFVINKASPYSVAETLDRLTAIVCGRGMTLFGRIDHSGEAAKVGLKMPLTQVLLFGNPEAGTPIMQAAPTSAIDLPLRALAWEDQDGKVWLSYNDPEFFRNRFGLTELQNQAVAGIGRLIDAAVEGEGK